MVKDRLTLNDVATYIIPRNTYFVEYCGNNKVILGDDRSIIVYDYAKKKKMQEARRVRR